ncbi:GIDE domain-containing protein [Halosegnis marinus]|uniref:RING-type E3 ubiquitin transferase n=1 Tax=Halosegnis marinus TaxID=3034023 RepID=A0ABD5ZSX3_9EURY|nr:GIDE domain-containing protein [Halosegnis sp. DT85]
MVSVVPLLAGVLFLAVGGYGVYRGRRMRAETALMEATETTDALAVTPGPVELVGRAEPTDDGPLPAPFTDEDALAAWWEIEEWEESGKHSSWRTEGTGTYATEFVLDDGTDRVVVRPDGANLEFDPDTAWVREIGVDDPLPEPVERFLAMDSTPGGPREAFIKALDWGQQVGDRKYRQKLIRPGDEVYVLGTATRVGAEEFGGNDFEVVAAADDGHRDAERFIVSNRSEAELVDARSNGTLYLAGGALLALVGAALLVAGLAPGLLAAL